MWTGQQKELSRSFEGYESNHSTGCFFPGTSTSWGCDRESMEALGKEFAKLGHEVTHISRKFEALPERSTDGNIEHIRVQGANACPNPFLLKFRELPYVLRARKHLPKANVLVTHTFGHLAVPQREVWEIICACWSLSQGADGLV